MLELSWTGKIEMVMHESRSPDESSEEPIWLLSLDVEASHEHLVNLRERLKFTLEQWVTELEIKVVREGAHGDAKPN